MNKVQYVLVVAESASGINELTSGAGMLGEKTELVYAGDKSRAVNVETAYYLGETCKESFVNYIPSIVSLVQQNKPQLVLVEATKNGRLAAAMIATAMGTSVLTDSMELGVDGDSVISKRMVYGGAAFKIEKGLGSVTVACVCGGVFEAAQPYAAGKIVDLEGHSAGVRFVERRAKESKTVNLAAAKRVVGVGRGFGSEENLVLARDLAKAIGAEVGCSRPVAEEEKWMPKEAYCGVSGVMIKPDIYIACGISGQVQHISGVNQSKVIVAINKDKSAPIFEKCDYGIVGDLKVVLPALTQKFTNN
jgi:electron transfer flavoprotein alpha subunit